MSPALVVSIIALACAAVTLLLGSNLLSRLMDHNAKAAVQADRQTRMEYEVKEMRTETTILSTNQAVSARNITLIESRLGKLDLIDGIAADVKHLLRNQTKEG